MTNIAKKERAQSLVNQQAQLTVKLRAAGSSICITVRILSWRWVFGRLEYRITPLAGNGTGWVREESITHDQHGIS